MKESENWEGEEEGPPPGAVVDQIVAVQMEDPEDSHLPVMADHHQVAAGEVVLQNAVALLHVVAPMVVGVVATVAGRVLLHVPEALPEMEDVKEAVLLHAAEAPDSELKEK